MASYVYEPEGRPDKNLLEKYVFSTSSSTSSSEACYSDKVKRVKKLAAKAKAEQKRKK